MVDFRKEMEKRHPLWLREQIPEGIVTTHYVTLLAPPGISPHELEQRYKALALQHHPDRYSEGERGPHTAVFSEITAAYAVLKNAASRHRYDQALVLECKIRACPNCIGTGLQERTKSFTKKEDYLCPVCRGWGQQLPVSK